MIKSLATVHPELIAEWSNENTISPDMISFGSNKLFWWKGKCGHEWQASPKSRSTGEKCPICAGKKIVEGVNDLKTLMPELASEWSPKNSLKPNEVTVGSNKKVIWKDKLGHEWTATVKNRAQGSGCPYCSHNAILEGFNDLASQKPDIATEWSNKNLPLLPTQVTVYANRKAWWRCKRCGNEWETLISTRSSGSKCPYCSGQILLKGFNDFATLYPQLLEEWSERNLPLTPDIVNDKSRKNVWWHCRACGYEWKSVIHSRANGALCPVCSDRAVLSGHNDLATTDAQLLSEWDFNKNTDISPESISRHSMYSVWWKCPLGHSWKEKVSERAIEGKGCKICESEYKAVFPKLAVMIYGGMRGYSVKFDREDVIGIPLQTYIPDEKLAIETDIKNKDAELLKKYLCEKRNIKYLNISYGKGDEVAFLEKIKKAFRSRHIFITSDTAKDAEIIKRRFYDWRLKHSQTINVS